MKNFQPFYHYIAENLVSLLPDISNGFRGTFIDEYYQKKGAKRKLSLIHLKIKLENVWQSGLDGLSAKLLKGGASVIASPLAHMFNRSLHVFRIK